MNRFAKYRRTNKGKAATKRYNEGTGAEYKKEYWGNIRDCLNRYKVKTGCLNPGCKWDGVFDASMLDFHHIDKSEKKFSIGCTRKSIPKLKTEIVKCTLVCSNCHRLITWCGLDAGSFPRCVADGL